MKPIDALERWLATCLGTQRGLRTTCFVVVAAVAFVLFLRLGAGPVEATTERRCAKVVSHMVESGDWLVPIKDDKPRLEKPPLYYWLATLSTLAVSDTMTPGTLRFPSALMAVLMVVLGTLWARSLGGWPLAIGTAFALLAMFHFFTLGRRGVAETTLGASALLAWMTFDRMHFRGQSRLLPWFAACFAFAWLAKATVSVLLIGVPIACFLWSEKKLKQAISGRLIAWLALALAVGAAWYVFVIARVPGAWSTIWSELRNSAGSPDEDASALHYGGPHFYLKELPLVAFPAAILLPAMIWRLVRTRVYRDDARKRFLAFVFLTLFVAWSLLPKKQRHYMIPILPVLATLLADATLALWAERRSVLEKALPALSIVLGLGAIVGAFYVGVWLIVIREIPLGWSCSAIASLALASIPLVMAGVRRKPLALTAIAFALIVPTLAAAFGYVRPWEDTVREAADAKRTLPGEANLVALLEQRPWVLKLYGIGDDVRESVARQRP